MYLTRYIPHRPSALHSDPQPSHRPRSLLCCHRPCTAFGPAALPSPTPPLPSPVHCIRPRRPLIAHAPAALQQSPLQPAMALFSMLPNGAIIEADASGKYISDACCDEAVMAAAAIAIAMKLYLHCLLLLFCMCDLVYTILANTFKTFSAHS